MIETLRKTQHKILDGILARGSWVGLEKRAEKFVQQFEKALAPSSSILDIGAGPGVYYEPLKRRGHEVTLLDVSEYKSCPHPVTYYDGSRLPFDDKSLDVSLLITVLHHVSEPDLLLSEAKRVSRDLVIVIEDVYTHPIGRAACILRDTMLNFEFFGHPFQFRSFKEWKESFYQLGFSISESQRFYSYLLGLPIKTGLYILKP